LFYCGISDGASSIGERAALIASDGALDRAAAERSSVGRSNGITSSISIGEATLPSHATARARHSDRKNRLLVAVSGILGSLPAARDRAMTRFSKIKFWKEKPRHKGRGWQTKRPTYGSAAGASTLDRYQRARSA
jgi:hypothetical protein